MICCISQTDPVIGSIVHLQIFYLTIVDIFSRLNLGSLLADLDLQFKIT